MTSCKDYDDDINNLQDQIDANKKAIDQINALITSGSVIKSVTQSSTGLTITLSNGQSYNVTNGKDGAPGTAWTISDDGYWVKDSEKTSYKALGKDGDPGAPGADGAYYLPKEDGYFYKVVNGNEEPTKIQWKASDKDALTGVMDNDNLTLSNVKYPDNTYKKVVISLSNNLRGFSFVTDKAVTDSLGNLNLQPQTVVDGVEAIQIQSLSYNALTLSKKDSKDETATAATKATVVNPDVYAYYKVEPEVANVEDLKALAYRLSANATYIKSRATASADFAVTPEFVEFKDGILKVRVGVKGTPATGSNISLVSLMTTKKNGEKVEQSDDPETIYKNDMKDLRIADKDRFAQKPAVDYHYRRYINTADAEAGAAVKTKPVWDTQDGSDYDLTVNYDESIDLKQYVETHELLTPHIIADDNVLGLSYEFELVKNYKIGTNKTDQADFASLAGGVLTPKVFDAATRYAAVGRTPVVRVLLKHGEEIVKVAYIKVLITKQKVEPKSVDLNLGELTYKCGEPLNDTTTVEQINKQVYNALDMDRDAFHALYNSFDAQNGVSGNDGTCKELTENVDGETTHLIAWTITEADAWNAAKAGGRDLQHTVIYKNSADSNQVVKITLKAKLNGFKTKYDVTAAQYINEYWNSAKTEARFNVAVPESVGSTDSTKCVMVNDLNSPFTTKNGKIVVADEVTDVKFFFCKKDMEAVTKIGDYTVKFEVPNDTTLLATVSGKKDTIATISNVGTAVPYNSVTLNKKSDVAKELLNTNKLVVFYGAKGNLCGDKDKVATITFQDKDHFAALFVRPVNVAGKAADRFVDAVDYGEKGSFIKLEDLINPTDWRNRSFADYTNYWQYYGKFSVNADLKNAKCDLNGTKQAVPATIVLTQEPAGTMGKGDDAKTSDYGFITYKNNGTHVKSFHLFIPVVVNYGWGTITVDEIKVQVAETIDTPVGAKKH